MPRLQSKSLRKPDEFYVDNRKKAANCSRRNVVWPIVDSSDARSSSAVDRVTNLVHLAVMMTTMKMTMKKVLLLLLLML